MPPAGLLEEALALAAAGPCDPRTLTRAARDHATKEPRFAIEAGLLALEWIARGHGYEITGADAWAAYAATMKAVATAGADGAAVRERVRTIIAGEVAGSRFLGAVLGREVGMQDP